MVGYQAGTSPFQATDLEPLCFNKSQTVTAVCNTTLSCRIKTDSETAHMLTLYMHIYIIRQTSDTPPDNN